MFTVTDFPDTLKHHCKIGWICFVTQASLDKGIPGYEMVCLHDNPDTRAYLARHKGAVQFLNDFFKEAPDAHV